MLYFCFGVFLTVIACSLAAHLLPDFKNQGVGPNRFNIFFVMMLLSSGVGLITTALRFRISLTPNSITVRRAFWTSSMARGDIAAWWESSCVQGGTNTVVYLFGNDRSRYKMRFPNVIEDVDAVSVWLDGIRRSPRG